MKILALLALLSTTGAVAKSPAKRTYAISTISAISGNPALKSREDRELIVVRVKQKKKAKNRFLIQGGLHGNETDTPKFVAWLANRILKGESELNKIVDADFDFLPVANPDGRVRESRYNAEGINLNRNFSVLWGLTKENPGTKKFSEPETQAIRHLINSQKYTAAVDVHGYINWIVAPTKMNSKNKVKNRQYTQWFRSLKKNLSQLGNYELKTAGELGDGGAFEDWAFWGSGSLAFCLEMQTPYQFGFLSEDDQFVKYEKYIYSMFRDAVKIKSTITH